MSDQDTRSHRTWSNNLSAADYVEYCMEVHSQARTTAVVIEILDALPERDRLRDTIERTTRVALRLRQRVVTPTLPVAAARWVTDPDFDLDYHLREVLLPAPGSLRQLLDLAQTIQATPLDLDRPLWEASLVTGLAPDAGAAAIIWKVGQPVLDGPSGSLFDRMVHSHEPAPELGPMPPIPVPEDLTPGDLTRTELRRLPGKAGQGLSRLIGNGARHPLGAIQGLRRLVRVLENEGPPPVADPSPLLRRRSLQRRFEALDVDLTGLQSAASAYGCSVQDAYLAAVCGGLRLYHDRLGVPVPTLPLAIPIDLRDGGEPVGDLATGLRLAAPIGQTDPVPRMRTLRRAVRAARKEAPATVLHAGSSVVPWLPVQLLGALGQAGRDVDVHVSSVAGHDGQIYVAGARVAKTIPIGPLLGGAVSIVACSLAGRHYVGINMDPLAVVEPELFVECLRKGFDEVTALGVQTNPSSPGLVELESPAPSEAGRTA